MTWFASKLNRRILFLEQVQDPNSAGGLTQTYKQLAKCWAGMEPVGTSAVSYVRDVQVADAPTHRFTVRRSLPAGVDTYGSGVVKATNFVYLLSGNTPTTGRLFRILSASNDDEHDETISFLAKEMGVLDTQKGIIK